MAAQEHCYFTEPEEGNGLEKNIPFQNPSEPSFRMVDLFAGIGGIRLPFQELNGETVFSSEYNPSSQHTYSINFGEMPFGDIRTINPKEIPEHDILLAGFPCQAFSIAGYRQGFDDEKGRGNLFFNIEKILKIKKPEAFLLENVKNLESHDNGKTYQEIIRRLENLGYSVQSKILNTMNYGNIPQNRERIYIVGFRESTKSKKQKGLSFKWPSKIYTAPH